MIYSFSCWFCLCPDSQPPIGAALELKEVAPSIVDISSSNLKVIVIHMIFHWLASVMYAPYNIYRIWLGWLAYQLLNESVLSFPYHKCMFQVIWLKMVCLGDAQMLLVWEGCTFCWLGILWGCQHLSCDIQLLRMSTLILGYYD